jgi:TBC1 domain family member 23 C-terminal
MKSKSAEVKEKLIEYIVNPTGSNGQATERHVKSSDKVSKRYRNMAPVFSIDDDDAGNCCLHNQCSIHGVKSFSHLLRP